LIEYKIYDKIYLQRLFAVFFMTIYLKTKKKKMNFHLFQYYLIFYQL